MKNFALLGLLVALGFPVFAAAEEGRGRLPAVPGQGFEAPPEALTVPPQALAEVVGEEAPAGAASVPVVRMIYLVPSDRAFVKLNRQRMELAIRELQAFYWRQLGRKTFALHDPVVEVVRTPHPTTWYTQDAPASSDQERYWESATADGFSLTGGEFNDPQNRWVFYLDADPLCGQATGGTSGVALLPANDLRGLTCKANRPVCPQDSPDLGRFCRWVGGLGHELGHSFNLPHPVPGTCPSPDPDCNTALMWFGYITYPNAYMLPADKQSLLTSPATEAFFTALRPKPVQPCEAVCRVRGEETP
jgi:hypothetical protein